MGVLPVVRPHVLRPPARTAQIRTAVLCMEANVNLECPGHAELGILLQHRPPPTKEERPVARGGTAAQREHIPPRSMFVAAGVHVRRTPGSTYVHGVQRDGRRTPSSTLGRPDANGELPSCLRVAT